MKRLLSFALLSIVLSSCAGSCDDPPASDTADMPGITPDSDSPEVDTPQDQPDTNNNLDPDMNFEVETVCDNDLDDNGDGRPDCADPSCLDDPACAEIPAAPSERVSPLRPGQSYGVGGLLDAMTVGEDPIQRDVSADLHPYDVGVIRGVVSNRRGQPVAGARVEVRDHADLGYTITRADGMFDLLVPTGGRYQLALGKPGHLNVYRHVRVESGEVSWVDDVSLTRLSEDATSVDLDAGMVAVGEAVEDERGPRTPRVYFPAGTTATFEFDDGTTEPAQTPLTIRMTEYTRQDDGPNAMPGDLPPTSAYTYAVELSADEAIDAGAAHVRFSQPVSLYVDNFLNLPVGATMPLGIYDPDEQWVPQENGIVLSIVSDGAGVGVDLDGDGTADPLDMHPELNLTRTELDALASELEPGKSYWRARLDHFSPCDLNLIRSASVPWPRIPFEFPRRRPRNLDDCEQQGSVIDCQARTMRDWIDVQGVPYQLWLAGSAESNNRVINVDAWRTLRENATTGLFFRGAKISLEVAGHRLEQLYTREEALAYPNVEFVPPTTDAWGRSLIGQTVRARVSITYFLERLYYVNPYGQSEPEAFAAYVPRGQIGTIATDERLIVAGTSYYDVGVNFSNASARPTIDVQHRWEPDSQTIVYGNGQRERAQIDQISATRSEEARCVGCYEPALEEPRDVQLTTSPANLATLTPRGDLLRLHRNQPVYVGTDPSDPSTYTVEARDVLLTHMGDGAYAPIWSRAHDFQRVYTGLRMSADGAYVYFVERLVAQDEHRLSRVDLETGTYEVVLELDSPQASGELPELREVTDWQLMPTGGFVMLGKTQGDAETPSYTALRVIEPEIGRVQEIVTTRGREDIVIDEREFYIGKFVGVDDEGRIYLSGSIDGLGSTVAQVSGVNDLVPVIGARAAASAEFDAVENDELKLDGGILDMIVTGEREIFVLTRRSALASHSVVEIGPTSSRMILGFDADLGCTERSHFAPDDCKLGGLERFVGVRPDRGLVMTNANAHFTMTRRIPWVEELGGLRIPSADHTELYLFDWDGRILATYHGHTGELLRRFEYTDDAELAAIEEHQRVRDRVTLTWDSEALRSIESSGGHRTTLTYTEDARLDEVIAPDDSTTRFTFDDFGRLTSRTNPNGAVKSYAYEFGALAMATRPMGAGSLSLAKSTREGGVEVTTFTDARGLITTYETDTTAAREYLVTTTHPSGAQSTFSQLDRIATTTSPTGVTQTTLEARESLPFDGTPRVRGVYNSYTVESPGGKRFEVHIEEQKTLANDPNGPLAGWRRQVRQVAGGAQVTWLAEYDAQTRTLTSSLPNGVVYKDLYDERGRLYRSERDDAGTIASTTEFDEDGRIAKLSRGGLSWEYEWSGGLMLSKVNAKGARHAFTYDEMARLATRSTPTSDIYTYGYDAMNDLASLRTPNSGEHTWTHNLMGERTSYTPPGKQPTTREYIAGDVLARIIYPDGRDQRNLFDSTSGLLTGRESDSATVTFEYEPASTRPSRVERAPTLGESVEYEYEFDGDLLTSTVARFAGTDAITTTFTHDDLWRVEEVRVGAQTFEMTRDGTGKLESLEDWRFERDGPGGALSRMTRGSVSHVLDYDEIGNMRSRTVTVSGSTRYQWSIEMDAAGLPETVSERVGAQTTERAYTFDATGRLVRVDRDGALEHTYTWDANGNITDFDGVAATYDLADEITSWGDAEVTHDVNGRVDRLDGWALEYSVRGDLERARNQTTGEDVIFSWDAFGRLASRQGPTGTHRFLYNNPAEIYQVTQVVQPDGSMHHYLYDEMDHLIEVRTQTSTYLIAPDSVGSPRAVFSTNGTLLGAIEYAAFGQRVSNTATQLDLWIGFAGGLRDPSTGLLRFGHRHYAPQLGRWVSRDPTGFAGSPNNLYQYVNGNPVTYRDPTGLFCIGGSVYFGFGVGGSMCFGEGNTGVCFETGLGLGGGLDVQPFGDHPGNVSEVDINAKGSIGPLGIDGGFKRDSCGKYTFDTNLNFGPIQVPLVQLESGPKGTKGLHDGTLAEKILRKEANGNGRVSAKLEAKAVYRRCRRL